MWHSFQRLHAVQEATTAKVASELHRESELGPHGAAYVEGMEDKRFVLPGVNGANREGRRFSYMRWVL